MAKIKPKTTIKRLIKKTLIKILPNKCLNLLKKLKNKKSLGYVLILHRVSEKKQGKLAPNENMKVSLDYLDKNLDILKEKFDIIPITEIKNRQYSKNKKKFLVITLDDGYKDNLYEALPIFEKHKVPFTVFVVSDFINQSAILWWYELEDLLLKHDTITLANGKTYECQTIKQKEEAFLKIRSDILILDQSNLLAELNELFLGYNIDWTAKNKDLCMNQLELKQLASNPLVTIGGHTKQHLNLKMLPQDEDVADEIESGKRELEHFIEDDINYFAYPYGSTNEVAEREFKNAEKVVSELSFTAYHAGITKQNIKKLHSLPRIAFTEEFNINNLP